MIFINTNLLFLVNNNNHEINKLNEGLSLYSINALWHDDFIPNKAQPLIILYYADIDLFHVMFPEIFCISPSAASKREDFPHPTCPTIIVSWPADHMESHSVCLQYSTTAAERLNLTGRNLYVHIGESRASLRPCEVAVHNLGRKVSYAENHTK